MKVSQKKPLKLPKINELSGWKTPSKNEKISLELEIRTPYTVKTKKELAEAILSSWDEIEQEIINKTIISVTKRHAKLAIDNEGEWS